MDLGQDSLNVQYTVSPVLKRATAVFPRSALQQKRAVPDLSLICLRTPRFPAERLRTSRATLRLLLSNTRHCTALLPRHLSQRASKLHALASTGKRAYASLQLSTSMLSTTAMSNSFLPFLLSVAFKDKRRIMPGTKGMVWRGDRNSTSFRLSR